MKIKCDYCSSYINDTDEKCENCGAVNSHLQRNANKVPKTIQELKDWYIAHNLPDETITRFFIGKDYKEPKAFGIYKDEQTGDFVVYKNKDTGDRAIRYQGKDEVYAVNELYLKLKEEIVNQKQNNIDKSNNKVKRQLTWNIIALISCFALCFIIPFIVMIASLLGPSNGYYRYRSNYYYYQGGDWYIYDYYDGWEETKPPKGLKDEADDYYKSNSYDSYYGIDDFKDTSYYKESSSSSDWDSSSSWDSGSSWDSSSTDWSSDW